MEVLFNYKRTIEDLKRCGPKGRNVYGFPLVSECVGSSFIGPCKNMSLPVPCGDGTCRSDYVDCLRAMSRLELKLPDPDMEVPGAGAAGAAGDAAAQKDDAVNALLASAGAGDRVLSFGSGGKLPALPPVADKPRESGK
jgi:hypothetical protein